MKKIITIAFLFCFGGALTASARTIAYWPFGEKGLQDASGQGNDLEADANVSVGETAVLNGAHTLFATKNALDLSAYKSITVEFWTKFKATENPAPVMLMEFSSSLGKSNPNSFCIDYAEKAGALVAMGFTTDYTGADDNAEVGVGDGEWHHVAFVFDSTDPTLACTTLYVDRTHVYTTSSMCPGVGGNNQSFPAGKKLYIGSRNNKQFKFVGEFDNIRVSSGRLRPEQFLDRDGRSSQVPALAYWPFGSAGIADMSGNGHDLLAVPVGRLANGAAVFDGTGLPLGTRLPVDLRGCKDTGFTAEFWMHLPQEATTITQLLIEQSADSSVVQDVGSTFCIAANNMSAKLASVVHLDVGGNGQYHVDKVPDTVVADDDWHHVAFVYDPFEPKGPDTFRLYLDGVQQVQEQAAAYSRSDFLALANAGLFIGGRRLNSNNGRYVVTGEIDDVRVTACPLVPEQFQFARTTENAPVLGWWRFDRGDELMSAWPDGVALVADGQVSFVNGSAVMAGGSLAAQSAFGLTDVTDLTAECFIKTDGTWRHLVKIWSGGVFDGEPTSVMLDGNSVESADWADVLALSENGGFVVATSGFAGEIDDVRVTAAALADGLLLASRSDDTPRELVHWHFDSLPGTEDDSQISGLKATVEADPSCDICDQACRFSRGMGLRTQMPLLLSGWNALTIECFARFKPGVSGNIFELGGNFNNQVGAFCLSTKCFGDSGPGFGFKTSDGYNIRYKADEVTDGDWHHYACVVERNGIAVKTAFYIDGVAMNNSQEFAATSWAGFADEILYLGSRWSYSQGVSWSAIPTYVGDLDELRIVNGALKPEEMMTLADRQKQNSRAIAHWTFDGDSPLADKSGNGHDLTGTADVSDGVVTFGTGKALQTVDNLPLSGCRQVTVEMVFRLDDLTAQSILFETSPDYGSWAGSIGSCGNGDGSLATFTYKLARQSDKSSVIDRNWHRLVVQYDMDADVDDSLCRCRGYLDGVLVNAGCLLNDKDKMKANANFRDYILYLGSRAGTGLWLSGQMKEVRISEGIVPVEQQLKCPVTETADHVVAFWPFSRQKGKLADASGNGHDLADPATGVTFPPEKGCADFSAGHSELRTVGKIDFSRLDAFTVECFVRAPKGSPEMAVLGTCKTFAQRQTGLMFSSMSSETDVVGVNIIACGGFMDRYGKFHQPTPILSGGHPFDGRWHHIALVVDHKTGEHGTESYYFDRQLVQTANLPYDVALPSTPLAIGSLLGVAGGLFVGQIDDVRISSVARTPDTFLQRRTSDAGCYVIIR